MVKRRHQQQQNSNMLGVSIVVCAIATMIAWGLTNPELRGKLTALLPNSKTTSEKGTGKKTASKKKTAAKKTVASDEADPFDSEYDVAGVASLDETDDVPVSREPLRDNVYNPFEDEASETRLVSNEVANPPAKRQRTENDPFADFETGEKPVETAIAPAEQSADAQAEEMVETPRLFEEEPAKDLNEEGAPAGRTALRAKAPSAVRESKAAVEEDPFEKPVRRTVSKSRRKISQMNYEEASEPQELDLNRIEVAAPRAEGFEEDVPVNNEDGGLDLAVVRKMIANGEEAKGHRILSDWYWKFPENRALFQKDLDQLATQIYFSPQPHYEEPYLIQPGDRLSNIGQEYQVSWRYLSKLNQVDPKKIRVGKKLKVFQGPFSASVDLSDFELTVHQNGLYVRKYKIGIGKQNSSPIGEFIVREKLENPTYYGTDGNVVDADDPLNPLGERWIDIGDGFGIHGTMDPKSIGAMHSKGCIRMLNSDVEEVYDLLTLGSSVKVQR
ncbi:MAG: L,D-transpeptidase family protein [Planctomycetaceae bacterium]|nr:L,D-transpeptidase family protein [Planctomycetaceae bacterium]